ncbi:uncharacterized protein IL334_005679 [Kwoniella shivajii]|uniref:Transfer RNA methyltransferase 82 n=1 Tax=Kwoniella shivajii TaxID=564305 RepID=A0ABZ1D5C3_9TREE|nr:hypothetical protein IL334_005679 [Kwoniella shivajii]
MSNLSFPPLALASSSNSLVVAAGSSVVLLDPSSSKVISSPSVDNRAHQNGLIRNIAVSHDGKLVVSAGEDKSLKVWDVEEEELKLRSTRTLIKKASHVSFGQDQSIIISDKVGDVFSYPLDPIPSDPSTSKIPMYSLVSDPSKNPESTYLLGHVSVVNCHVVSPDGKHLITADRDEHIRVSRYPKSYVIERYLFGHDGFVSALHIPPSQPSTLISGGGDASLRIWDWSNGTLLSKVDIYPSVLPHRKVRSYMRKNKSKSRIRKPEDSGETSGEGGREEEETFYTAPEGYILPSGQGVCIKKIDSLQFNGKTMILFFSEGAAALHSFILSSDTASSPIVHTQALPYPILDFSVLPNDHGQIVVSLDTAWNVLKKNPGPGIENRQEPISREELSDTEKEVLKDSFTIIQMGENGELSESSSSSIYISSSLPSALPITDVKTLSNLNLYPLLNILPRWPGLDDDPDDTPISIPGTPASEDAVSIAPTSMTSRTVSGIRKNYTAKELAQLNTKSLGRLKAAGVDIGNLLVQRQKKAKEENRKRLVEEKAKASLQQGMQPAKKNENGPEKKKKKVQIDEEDLANSS